MKSQLFAYKAQIFPSQPQSHWIEQSKGNRRFIWNSLLALISEDPRADYKYIDKYKKEVTVKAYSKKALQHILTHHLSKEHEFLKLSHSQSNQEAAHALSEAFSNAFNPKMKNFMTPRFKKKTEGGKFFLPCQNDNIAIDFSRNKILIKPMTSFIKKHYQDKFHKNDATFFELNFKQSGVELPQNFEIKGITIEKDNLGKYYASFIIETAKNIELIDQRIEKIKASGFDLGVASQLISSEGQFSNISKKYLELESDIKALQKALARKIESKKLNEIKKRKNITLSASKLKKLAKKRAEDKYQDKKVDLLEAKSIKSDNSFSKEEWKSFYESKKAKKLQLKINKISKKIANIRKDHNHKLSKKIIDKNDVVFFEDLNISGMVRNKKLSKSILDKSWGQLLLFCEYKAKNQGKIFHKINRFYPSSKLCHCCDYKMPELPLSIREWTCPSCLEFHDRDHNAALNILRKGLLELGYYEEEVEFYIKKVKNHTTWTRTL